MRHYSTTAGEMVLQSGISSGDTTLIVDTTAGLPVTFPYVLIVDKGTTAEEVVDATAASGMTLTVTRGRDGTTAQAHAFGAKIRHGVTARDFRESREHEAAAAAHGVTEVVGTTDAQTLDNKTFEPAADNAAAIFKAKTGNTVPYAQFHTPIGGIATGVDEIGWSWRDGGTNLATMFHASAAAFFKRILTLRVASDVHGLEGQVTGSPTGRFIRLVSGVTELFYVAATGFLKATGIESNGNVAVTGNVTATGTVTGTNITALGAADTALAAADTALDARLDVLEGQTLNTRVTAVETNLGAQTTFAATSAGKDAKRLHWGTATGTPDGSGYFNVTHGAGFTPTVVVATYQTIALQMLVDTIGATTFRVRVINSDGSASTSTQTISYLCGE